MKYLISIFLGLMLISLEGELPLLHPIQKSDFKYISSPFGWRSHPVHGNHRFHNGIDIVSKTNQARIFATANGSVQIINWEKNKAEGLSILVQHRFGFQTKYAHLSKIIVKEGEAIKAGQAIGIIGSTGNAMGVHLHYEIRYEGVAVDPVEVRKRLGK